MAGTIDLEKLMAMMAEAGADQLYVKRMSPNDNSKNQPYFGGDFSVLNIMPYGEVRSEALGKRPNFKTPVNFSWLLDDGTQEQARYAQFILYPKYPEVRFSGFLKGCRNAPNDLMNSREEGRLLFLGVTDDERMLGYATWAGTPLAKSFNALEDLPRIGVFEEISLDTATMDTRKLLLSELLRIHQLDWVRSKKLIGPGAFGPCEAPHCGGMTLEAELGIMPNGFSEPDFHGWEVKQHTVNKLEKPDTGVLTLMTPEPVAGYYRDAGVEAFVRKYGYEDKMGRPDRLNFGGVHKVGQKHPSTHLTMVLDGFDADTGKITNPDGGIVLRDEKNHSAAEWKFTEVFAHWKKKHAKAVYVPSEKLAKPLQYRYGNLVRLGVGTDPLKLLQAMAVQAVYYDPGIKLEEASTLKPKIKRRSQFRVNVKHLATLYHRMEQINLENTDSF